MKFAVSCLFLVVVCFYEAQTMPRGLAKSAPDSKSFTCGDHCFEDLELQEAVKVYISDAFEGCQNDNQLCCVAETIATWLHEDFQGNWVVYVDAERLRRQNLVGITSSSKPGHSAIITYLNEFEVYMAKAECQEPKDLTGANAKDSTTRGLLREVTPYATDMGRRLSQKVSSRVEKDFTANWANVNKYQSTSGDVYEYLDDACGGNWFVFTGLKSVLVNENRFCFNKYQTYETSNYAAAFNRTHGIQLFAPKCDETPCCQSG